MGRRAELPTRRALALALPGLALAPGLAARALNQAAEGQAAPAAGEKKPLAATVVLLRHAEKDEKGDAVNPGLSEAGKKRAAGLAKLLSRAKVTHLFASKYRRTQETLQPLAEATGLKVDTDQGALAARLAPRLLELQSGSVAVVAGHSNTIPAIAAALGAEVAGLETSPQGPVIPDKEYGRLFVLTPAPPGGSGGGRASLLELAYGD